jgi:EXS family/SPX domain
VLAVAAILLHHEVWEGMDLGSSVWCMCVARKRHGGSNQCRGVYWKCICVVCICNLYLYLYLYSYYDDDDDDDDYYYYYYYICFTCVNCSCFFPSFCIHFCNTLFCVFVSHKYGCVSNLPVVCFTPRLLVLLSLASRSFQFFRFGIHKSWEQYYIPYDKLKGYIKEIRAHLDHLESIPEAQQCEYYQTQILDLRLKSPVPHTMDDVASPDNKLSDASMAGIDVPVPYLDDEVRPEDDAAYHDRSALSDAHHRFIIQSVSIEEDIEPDEDTAVTAHNDTTTAGSSSSSNSLVGTSFHSHGKTSKNGYIALASGEEKGDGSSTPPVQLQPVTTPPGGPMYSIVQGDTFFEQACKTESNNFYAVLISHFDVADRFFKSMQYRLQKKLAALARWSDSELSNGTTKSHGDFRRAHRHQHKAYMAIYRHIINLQGFATLNYTAARKISKKFDKHVKVDPSMSQLMIDHLPNRYFCRAGRLEYLLSQTEREYARHFTGGDTKAAVFELQQSSTKVPLMDSFFLGLNTGIFVCLVFAMFGITQVSSIANHQTVVAVAPVFRAALSLTVFVWLWGVLVYTFERMNINHSYIFEFNPADSLRFFQIFKLAAALTVVVTLTSYLFFAALHNKEGELFGVPARMFLLVSLILFVVFLLNPFDVLNRSSRRVLARLIAQVIVSPFSRVRFVHVYVGDVMTSLVHPLADLEYTVCFYASGEWRQEIPTLNTCNNVKRYALPFIMCAPYFWRGMQNLRRYYETGDAHPNLTNAGKYLSGIVLTLLGLVYADFVSEPTWDAGRVIWLLVFVIEVVYMYTWDLLMDWGFRPLTSRNFLLRDQLLYPHRWVYYFAIVSNFFARFVWGLTITPLRIFKDETSKEVLVLGLSLCEILRRFQWSFFRVENEYLSNEDKLRSVSAIPLMGDYSGGSVAMPVARLNSAGGKVRQHAPATSPDGRHISTPAWVQVPGHSQAHDANFDSLDSPLLNSGSYDDYYGSYGSPVVLHRSTSASNTRRFALPNTAWMASNSHESASGHSRH